MKVKRTNDTAIEICVRKFSIIRALTLWTPFDRFTQNVTIIVRLEAFTMNYHIKRLAFFLAPPLLGLVLSVTGCTKQKATDTLEKAGAAATTAKENVEAAVEDGAKFAGELSDAARSYLAPLKDKIGNLHSLKDSPDELKRAVSELIQSIEEKGESIKLPKSVVDALATIKEKLIALRDSLEKNVEQAKIDEHIKDLEEAVKSGLGMSNK